MIYRDDKLKSTFLSEINNILNKKQDLKEMGLITITDVEVVDEGRTINVYFSVFGDFDEDRVSDIKSYLDDITDEIRRFIRKRVKTRFVPNIVFEYDNTPLKASRIDEILKKIQSERNDKDTGT